MSRDFDVRLDDIRDAINRIRSYTSGLSADQFTADSKTQDAVIRCLEVVGEAVKALPPEIRARRPEVPWNRIAGLRDILAHEYFGVNLTIIWDIVTSKLDELNYAVMALGDPQAGSAG
jgi:uncharacterized protein with HEPN domain